jgi:hypothetical protein
MKLGSNLIIFLRIGPSSERLINRLRKGQFAAVPKHHALKAYKGVEIKFKIFVTPLRRFNLEGEE